MNKRWYFIGGFLLGLALFTVSLRFYSWNDLVDLLVHIPLGTIAAYAAVSFLIFLTLAARWWVVCRQHGIKVPYINLLGYRYVGFAVSFITPGPRIGGEPVRAGLLMRHNQDYPTSLSTVVADKTIELTTFGVLFIICLAALLLNLALDPISQIVFGTVGLIILGLMIFVFYTFSQGRDPILTLFRYFRLDRIKALQAYEKEIKVFEKNITRFYKQDKKKFVIASALSMLAWSISFVEYHLLLGMLGVDATIIHVFAVYSTVGLAYLIPIPFALGSLEAAQTGMFAALKLPREAGVGVAFITRGRDLVRTLIGFILLSYYGASVVKKNERET